MDQDRELVAAETRSGVDRAHAVLQASRDLLQDPVASSMAEAVVDVLEVVHVHEQDRDRQALPSLRRECVADPVAEQRAVGQAGQDVVEGLVLELRLEGLALADVAQVQHDARDRLIAEQVRRERFDVAPTVLLCMAHAELSARGLSRRQARDRRDEREHPRLLVGVHELREGTVEQRVRAVAEGLLHRGAEVVDARVLGDDADHVG